MLAVWKSFLWTAGQLVQGGGSWLSGADVVTAVTREKVPLTTYVISVVLMASMWSELSASLVRRVLLAVEIIMAAG